MLLLGPVVHRTAHGRPAGLVPVVGLIGDMPICHADAGGADDGAVPGPSHPDGGMDCDLCAVCQTLGAPVVLLPSGNGEIPPAPAVAAVRALLPPSRAPPRRPLLAAAFPTGPPCLT